jgi:hypothetical protein
MATPTTTARRAQGFGAPRFLVRGPDFASEESLGIIRPLITDYPERVTQNPLFPFPGRRGGSRPREEVLARESVPHDPNFPQPRPRDKPVDTNPFGGLPAPGTPSASPIVECVGLGGTHLQSHLSVLTLTVTVQASFSLNLPFVIRYLEVVSDGGIALSHDVRVKIAQDNNISGGLATTGVPLDSLGFGGAEFHPGTEPQRAYPNIRWTEVPAFIKLIFNNQDVATHFYHVILSLDWLT